MNITIVKSAPQGKFETISIEMLDWKSKFQSLISQRRGIEYQIGEMPNISKELRDKLSKHNFIDLILESDHGQHFLVPRNLYVP